MSPIFDRVGCPADSWKATADVVPPRVVDAELDAAPVRKTKRPLSE
jgi:hypothetical protein